MKIVVSGTRGELADFVKRIIGYQHDPSQQPYEAKLGYVPLQDFRALVKAAPGANCDTAQKEPSIQEQQSENKPGSNPSPWL